MVNAQELSKRVSGSFHLINIYPNMVHNELPIPTSGHAPYHAHKQEHFQQAAGAGRIIT